MDDKDTIANLRETLAEIQRQAARAKDTCYDNCGGCLDAYIAFETIEGLAKEQVSE